MYHTNDFSYKINYNREIRKNCIGNLPYHKYNSCQFAGLTSTQTFYQCTVFSFVFSFVARKLPVIKGNVFQLLVINENIS